jgi:hypothetical protein
MAVKALHGCAVNIGVNIAQKLNATSVLVLHHAISSKRKITTLITIRILVTVRIFFMKYFQ